MEVSRRSAYRTQAYRGRAAFRATRWQHGAVALPLDDAERLQFELAAEIYVIRQPP